MRFAVKDRAKPIPGASKLLTTNKKSQHRRGTGFFASAAKKNYILTGRELNSSA